MFRSRAPMSVLSLALVFAVAARSAPAQDPQAEARKHIAEGRFAEAVKELGKLPRPKPANPEVARLWIEAFTGLRDWENVLHHGAPYLRTAPKDVAAQIRVGEALFNLGAATAGDAERAAAYAEQALECAEAALREKPDAWPALELKCRALVAVGKAEPAIAFALTLVESAPGDLRAHRLLAAAQESAGKPGEAVATLRGAERIAPGDGGVLFARAQVHERANQLAEAIRAVTEALRAARLSPDDLRGAAERIWSLCAIHKDFPGAHRIVDAWLEDHADDALAHWWRAYLHDLEGRFPEAEGEYQRAWDLSGRKLGEAALHLGHFANRRGDAKSALPLFAEAIRLKAPVRAGVQAAEDALLVIAAPLVEAGKLKEAVDLLEKHGGKESSHPVLRQNLGFHLRELGSAEDGKRNKSRARELWKRSAEHYVVAAANAEISTLPDAQVAQILNDTGLMFHYHLEQPDRGIEYYQRAIEYDPNYLDALENMGVVLSEKKLWADAIAWYDRVLALAPKRAASLAGKQRAEEAIAAGTAPGK